jgi:predicted MFS family arabinose efflux permease
VIGYGIVQSFAPVLLRRFTGGRPPQGRAAAVLAALLALVITIVTFGVWRDFQPELLVVVGLGLFGFVFAVNSSVHSYLILAYSDGDKVAMNVGFYYMANAGGRLVGTVLSGVMYQQTGLVGCLVVSSAFALAAAALALYLPAIDHPPQMSDAADGGD